jgi:hypothetical protein
MPNVFISYSHQDRESATQITRALADRHVLVRSDQEIREGAEWEREIEKGLTEAKVLILCLSPSFLASDWAQLEIGMALSRSRESNLRVIPLILEGSEIPPVLNRFQFLDARDMSADQVAASIQKIVETSN